jgi:hypothetical protein
MATLSIDEVDKLVYTNTVQIRKEYDEARKRLGLPPRDLTDVTIGMRSITP